MSEPSKQAHIGVIGAGAWGTALAILANRAGSKATLWTRNAAVRAAIGRQRVNSVYLPDQFIDPQISVTEDLASLAACDALILTIPAQSLRTVVIGLSDVIHTRLPMVLATKGIERGSLMLMSEVLQTILPHNPYAVLSGPNFAGEAAAGLPTATVLASHHLGMAENLAFMLGGKYFRIYIQDDPIGAQIGGALKNVLAIGAGICEGRGMGENARAALITRGVAEIARLAKAKEGKETTLMGLAGMGDILLSCTSTRSRNFALGLQLGKGGKPSPASDAAKQLLTEGVATAESVYLLSRKMGVSMPISWMVHEVLSGKTPVDGALEALLERPVPLE
jgi:glycerol-3-phosphate dehydrogenase (NAD(P)+)